MGNKVEDSFILGVLHGAAGNWVVFGISLSCALVISHICSLMEAAVLSITPSQLAELRQKHPALGEIAINLKREIDKPLAVILILNTAAHTIGAAVAGASFSELGYGSYMGVFSLIFTLVMVQYTELLPKTLGVRFNTTVLRVALRPLYWATVILAPLIKLTKLINRPFEGRAPARPTPAEEISALAAMARSSQAISSRQERIIRMVPSLSEKSALEVMIALEDVSFLDADMSLDDAINATGNDFHTRYPLCIEGDRSRVPGYVNIKEIILAVQHGKGDMKVSDIMRPIAFADSDDTASKLLEMFAAQHCHMTIIRDAVSGKTCGLVTLEDIVEELIGDLDDEFDPLPRTFYAPGDNLWVVGGGVPLTQLARDTQLDLPRRAESVSSWFGREMGKQVKVGDTLTWKNAVLFVRKVRRRQAWEFHLKRRKLM
ncbi:MAG: HlyC/CorC family transporter [Lentisphaerae bacterium]|nr:HlyC/CorC family transporter [Lentisphaerota bacterium]